MSSRHQPEHWIRRLRKHLQSELSMSERTVDLYEPLMWVFLDHLAARKVSVEVATEADLKKYMDWHQRRYRRRRGREAEHLPSWRCHHIVPIRHLLRVAQGEWPPSSSGRELLRQFEEHLVERGRQMPKEYRRPARLFATFLDEHRLDASKVQPSDVAKFLRVGLTLASPGPSEVTLVSNWSRVMRAPFAQFCALSAGNGHRVRAHRLLCIRSGSTWCAIGTTTLSERRLSWR